MIRVDEMTDQQIVKAYAAEFARKAQEAYDALQCIGMRRYENAYHKYNAIAEALERDAQKAKDRQARAKMVSQVVWLGSMASMAMRKNTPDALLEFAREVVAVARLYGYDDRGELKKVAGRRIDHE